MLTHTTRSNLEAASMFSMSLMLLWFCLGRRHNYGSEPVLSEANDVTHLLFNPTGCQVSMRCTILADMIGHEKLSTGFGMMSVLDAIGVFLGPASAGR
jgi:hypothetical protein